MSDTDLELLARYTRQQAEDAFAELVRRHLDLVHSAALRQVRSPQLAEEVAQSAFVKLARLAPQLAPDTILTAWLYQVTRREAIDVVRREARRQLREQTATELKAMNANATDWTHIGPMLDEAMSTLDETDRAAVLLRYFENKSLRDVGITLGTTDDAAQKRVRRAVERLREYFARRGVPVGPSALTVVLAAHAVQAAPTGLAVTIATAATLTGTTLATATVTATKAIAMTTLQKTLITVTLAVLAGAGIYEARQAVQLRAQVQALQQRQSMADQIQELNKGEHNAPNRLAELAVENSRLKPDSDRNELLRLRGEVSGLRRRNRELEEAAAGAGPGLGQEGSVTNFLAKEAWEFGGFDTPEGALRTCFWAQSSGFADVWLACLGNSSPDMVEGAKKAVAEGSVKAERTQRLMDATAKWTGLRILRVVSLSKYEALVQYELATDAEGQMNRRVTLQEMKKIHGIWKVCNSYGRDP